MPVQQRSDLTKSTQALAYEEWGLLTVRQLNNFAPQVPLLPQLYRSILVKGLLKCHGLEGGVTKFVLFSFKNGL